MIPVTCVCMTVRSIFSFTGVIQKTLAHAAMPSDEKETLKKYDPKHRYKNAQSQESLEISCNLRLFQGHENKLKMRARDEGDFFYFLTHTGGVRTPHLVILLLCCTNKVIRS